MKFKLLLLMTTKKMISGIPQRKLT